MGMLVTPSKPVLRRAVTGVRCTRGVKDIPDGSDAQAWQKALDKVVPKNDVNSIEASASHPAAIELLTI